MHVYCYCLAGLGRSGGTLSRAEKVSDEKHYYLHQLANIFLRCWWLNYCMYGSFYIMGIFRSFQDFGKIKKSLLFLI